MICPDCGTRGAPDARFCQSCGKPLEEVSSNQRWGGDASLIGYSKKISDPAFAKYIKNSKRWAIVFSIIIAVIAIIGFTIYGEVSSDMDNPQAFFIGLIIGGIFLLIGLFQVIAKNRDTTWDGTVFDKKIEKKQRKNYTSDDDYYWDYYTEYIVYIRSSSGKTHRICVEDDDTVYNYYQIGDRVRHHKGLNSYEKYDKSKDTIIFCNACGNLHDINEDYCSRCQCPLLK